MEKVVNLKIKIVFSIIATVVTLIKCKQSYYRRIHLISHDDLEGEMKNLVLYRTTNLTPLAELQQLHVKDLRSTSTTSTILTSIWSFLLFNMAAVTQHALAEPHADTVSQNPGDERWRLLKQ